MKFSILRVYTQFYNQVKIIGLLIALLTFGMFATSGGYYLLITRFGTDKAFSMIKESPKKRFQEAGIVLKTDPESIRKGKELYESKCYFCHDAYSNKRERWGPGIKAFSKIRFFL